MSTEKVTSTAGSVLVLTADQALREEIRRAAAAADRDCTPAHPPIPRYAWQRAPMVVLDAMSAGRCVEERLPRRPGIVLVTTGEPRLDDWQRATAIGVERVIALPQQAAALVEALGAYPVAGSGDGVTVAVVGGSGGAGASVLAAAVALRAAKANYRPHTLLVDGDRNGGGLDLLLGIDDQDGLRWPGLVLEGGRIAAASLHNALPGFGDGLSVLSWGRRVQADMGQAGMSVAAVESVLDAGRDAGDLVVCDVARERTAQAEAMLAAADLAVLVVQADLRSAVAASSASVFVRGRNLNQGLVIRGPAPGGLTAANIAAGLGLPLLTAMRTQPRLGRCMEQHGLRLTRRGPLRRAADAVLTVLADRPTTERVPA